MDTKDIKANFIKPNVSGFSPEQWGRQTWHYLHSVALAYPEKPTEDDKAVYSELIKMFQLTLPCGICSDHLAETLKSLPPRLDSGKDFFEWTVDLHNLSNSHSGKPILSYQQALTEYYKNSTSQNLEVPPISKVSHLPLVIFASLSIFLIAMFPEK